MLDYTSDVLSQKGIVMNIDDVLGISLLYDFYGQLLTKRQQEVMSLYHEENLSLSEIADEFGISRAGVHDSLKKAEKALMSYEEKLGLVKRFSDSRNLIESIDERLEKLISDNSDNESLTNSLIEIRNDIDNME